MRFDRQTKNLRAYAKERQKRVRNTWVIPFPDPPRQLAAKSVGMAVEALRVSVTRRPGLDTAH